ncbi:MAG TPA: TetR/AcrR family transcriptional regulator [Streptosporangiaceae bacterium]|jgi:TetR/AcrR family transcriptional repressor of mexJK operon
MSHAAPRGTRPAGEDDQPEGRSARKRRAIVEAAAGLFLDHGYQGTSMDEIAALAAVSKQTVYKNFSDKEQLFSDIVLGAAARADEFIQALPGVLAGTDDLRAGLQALARQYLATVMQPRLLQLRRLIISEAGRFPDLARTYYQRVPERVMDALATQLGELAGRGLLRADDPQVAASHLAFLILGLPLDRAMFLGTGHELSAAELDRRADDAVDVFLAAYGRP